ncbi:hypothetical protein TNIN_195691, partial [Trichonephila inaurata madagascariensis]
FSQLKQTALFTPYPKDFVAQVVWKSSPDQPSNASRRHPNKQKEEKRWQGRNRNSGNKPFHHSRASGLKCPLLNLRQGH